MATAHRDRAKHPAGSLRPVAVSTELNVEHRADAVVLRYALGGLAADDRRILLDRHLHGRTMTSIAGELGLHPHAMPKRLRRAEDHLAHGLADAHARFVDEPECRTIRMAMYDYLAGHLLPHRQRRLEVHMNVCTGCTRAFVDVRDVSWALRELGHHVLADGVIAHTAGVPAGAAGQRVSRRETGMAAGVLVAVTVVGAAAYIANLAGAPADQVLNGAEANGGSPGTGDLGAGAAPTPGSRARTDAGPPSIQPADPQPRPTTTPKDAPHSAQVPPVTAEPAGTATTVTDGERDAASAQADAPSGPDAAPDGAPGSSTAAAAAAADPPAEPASDDFLVALARQPAPDTGPPGSTGDQEQRAATSAASVSN